MLEHCLPLLIELKNKPICKTSAKFMNYHKSAEVLLHPLQRGISLGSYLWLQRCKYFAVRGLEKISVLCYNVHSKKATSGWSLRIVRGGASDMRFKVWPQSWPFTGLDYVGIMDFVARKSTVFGRKSTKKHEKRGKKPMLLRLGRRCRRFESCHSDHMKIIRTFSYLEKRSDYLFYLSIQILIARNENSLRQGFSLSEATIIR